MNISYHLPPLIASGIAAILLGTVLVKGRRHSSSRIFSFIIFLTMIWGLFTFFMRSSPDIEHALLWDKFIVPIGFTMFICYFYFATAFTGTKRNKVLYFLSYCVIVLIIALSSTPLVIKEMGKEYYGFAPKLGIGAYILIPFGVIFVVIAFYRLILSYKKSIDYNQRNRLLWIIIAMLFPVLGSIPEMYPTAFPTAIYSNIAFCLFVSVAIFKYRLFDVRIILKKGLSYFLISVLVAIPYACIIAIATWALGNKQIPIWILLIPLILLAFTVNPLWKFVQKTVDRAFYGKRYSSLTALERFSQECTGIIELESLSDHLISLALPAMGASSAHLLMPRGNDMNFSLIASSTVAKNIDVNLDHHSILVSWLEQHDAPLRISDIDYISPLEAVTSKERDVLNMLDADLMVPFKYRDRLSGILVLGPKLSTEQYTGDDLSSLVVLARHASTAIENARLYAQSQEMAIRDGVTGFYNHSFFQERAREEVEQAKKLNMPVSLLMINIDLFHIYNEIHGHAEGDRALNEMAKVIRSMAKGIDLLFRYSGDEFAMLAPGMKCDEAYMLAERMRKAVESHHFPGLVSGKGVLTISIGIACYPEHVADAETLAFCAELALLESKKKGRNTITTYAPIEAAESLSSKTPDKRAALSKASQLSYVSTILALAAALDAKDPFTYGHSQKVAKYAVLLGEAIGVEPERLSALRTAALLHDIGKIGVPDSLLLKPQRFSDEERIEIQKHATLAVNILKHIPSLSNLLPHIVHHHERFDGAGYPDGMRGEDIPLESRILSIADSYDAMTSPRPYKPTLTAKEALAEIKKCAGTQFDPKLVNIFCEVIGQNGYNGHANN